MQRVVPADHKGGTSNRRSCRSRAGRCRCRPSSTRRRPRERAGVERTRADVGAGRPQRRRLAERWSADAELAVLVPTPAGTAVLGDSMLVPAGGDRDIPAAAVHGDRRRARRTRPSLPLSPRPQQAAPPIQGAGVPRPRYGRIRGRELTCLKRAPHAAAVGDSRGDQRSRPHQRNTPAMRARSPRLVRNGGTGNGGSPSRIRAGFTSMSRWACSAPPISSRRARHARRCARPRA